MKPLTERDLEVLDELVYMRWESSSKRFYEGGTAPLDFGGSNGSHHGKTATKLCKHGFVEQRFRGLDWGQKGRPGGARGSKLYRATPAGWEAISAFRTLKKGEMLKSGGNRLKFGSMVPTSSWQPLNDEDRKLLRLKCHLDMPAGS